MIYSVTQFGNIPGESELLRVRLAEELPYIDRFVVVESDRTHSGKSKPYGLKSLPDVFNNPKVDCRFIHVPVQPTRQAYYDLQAAEGIRGLQPGDVLIYTDLDEVNDRRDMPRIIQEIQAKQYIHLSLYNHQYFMNYFGSDWQYRWTLGFGCTYEYLVRSGKSVFDMRFEWNPRLKYKEPIIFFETTGHHFSYMLTPEQIITKISNTSDTCFDIPKLKDVVYIRKAISQGYDVLQRRFGEKVWHAEAIDDRYPESIRKNLATWSKHITEVKP